MSTSDMSRERRITYLSLHRDFVAMGYTNPNEIHDLVKEQMWVMDELIAKYADYDAEHASPAPSGDGWLECPSCGGKRRPQFAVCYSCNNAQKRNGASEHKAAHSPF